jgi:non-ribosomal peptide synthase protein (TIGR01720 family)
LLLLVAHHLCFDGVSIAIFISELTQALNQAARAEPITLTAPPATWSQWCHAVAAFDSADLDTAAAQWLALPWHHTAPLITDHTGDNTYASIAHTRRLLSPDHTHQLLHNLPTRTGAHETLAMLAALAAALPPLCPAAHALVDWTGSGREHDLPIDTSRTIGYITSIHPILLPLPREPHPHATASLAAIRRHVSPWLPRWLEYGRLRYLSGPHTARFAALPRADIKFNYHGRSSPQTPLMHVIDRPAPGGLAPENRRAYLLNIEASVHDNQLALDFIFSRNLHYPDTIAGLADRTLAALTALCNPCASH